MWGKVPLLCQCKLDFCSSLPQSEKQANSQFFLLYTYLFFFKKKNNRKNQPKPLSFYRTRTLCLALKLFKQKA